MCNLHKISNFRLFFYLFDLKLTKGKKENAKGLGDM